MNLKSAAVKAVIVMVCLFSLSPAWAYMDDIAILEQVDIVKLTDPQLIDTYIDVIVEMEASKTFHTTSGFTPKEYTAYKNLLRYRIRLLMEIQKRGLEAPKLSGN
ncbi:MAG: hypothetical protein KA403_06080 [Candidatus Omnitrophica bacterium]|nr:hypothetical protein [Candidatus Omnitrophota bacterium]